MRKVILVDSPSFLKPVLLDKSKKLFKTIWSDSFSIERMNLLHVDSLIISEEQFLVNKKEINQISSDIKILVISSDKSIQEVCDATIQKEQFKTKLETFALKDLNLWLESEELVVKCLTCGAQSHWRGHACYACESEKVEMALGRNLIE